jgi:hypothetical protein
MYFVTSPPHPHPDLLISAFRLAHALASSFNFQGRVLKTFYVLTDDKVGAGPRLRPQSLNKSSIEGQGTSKQTNASVEASQPMETDSTEGSSTQPAAVVPASSGGLSLSAKLAAKRKNTDGTESVAKARR